MDAGADPLRQAEAKAYRRAARRRGRAGQAVLGILALLAALGGARIADALDTPGPLVLDAAVYAWAAIAALWLAGLPFALAGWRAARRAGLSRQGLRSWLGDQGKSLAIGAVLAPIAMTGLVAALREWPHGWWLPVTAGAIAIELLLSVVTPVLIVPLFMRSHPLPPGPLADDLHALAAARRRARARAARARGERQDLRLQRVRGRLRADAPDHALRHAARRRSGRRGAAGRDALGARARARTPRERRPLAPDRRLGRRDRHLPGSRRRGPPAPARSPRASRRRRLRPACRRCSCARASCRSRPGSR